MSTGTKKRKTEEAVAALLTSPTIAVAAQTVGISEATLWRWLQNPEFQEKYRAAKRQALTVAVARLQQAASGAVDTLEAVMTSSEAPSSSRVTAAKAVLEMALKAVELEELEARVSELETLLAAERGAQRCD